MANSIKEGYREFLEEKGFAAATVGHYIRGLRRLEELGEKIKKPIIKKPIYNLPLSDLETLRDCMLIKDGKRGDLYEFNQGICNRAPSAAIGQLIKYKQSSKYSDIQPEAEKQSSDMAPAAEQQINAREDYINFLVEVLINEQYRNRHVNSLDELGEKIGESVYDLPVSKLDQLLKKPHENINLYKFSAKYMHKFVGRAIRKLIKYKQSNQSSDTPIEPEEKNESYSITQIINDGCFLSEDNIKEMLKQLESKKNLILQGPPGTGKTWLAKKLAFALMGEKNKKALRVIQFHPNLSYEDFIRGWRPAVKNDDKGTLKLTNGPFLKMINKAKKNLSAKYVMVIEEINRGNPVQIFGEMLTLLEADKRKESESIRLIYRKKGEPASHIPDNVYVIGTMNIADRSLASLDLALRRRFAFYDIKPTFGEEWKNWVEKERKIDPNFLAKIEKCLETLNEKIADDSDLGLQFRIGHSYVTPSANEDTTDHDAWFRRVVKSQIIPLLKEYWPDRPEKIKEAHNILIPEESNDHAGN